MLKWPFARRRDDAIQRLDPQSAYGRWARTYPPRPHNALMEVEHATVLALLPEVRGQIVLDAACGTGRYLRELGDRGARVIGIDLSPAMLDRARGLTRRLARADLRALPFDAMSIDLVVCGLALGDVAELELALSEIARVLRPGGRVIYSVVHPAGGSAGWSRTFESEGRQWAVDGFWHSLDRHRQACAAAGLTIDEWREPEIACPERGEFARTADSPSRRANQRAVLVVRASVRRTIVEPT